MNEEIYVIGDVHGCYKTLCALIEQLPEKYNSKICFVGDLIDRGPNSKDVIELVKKHNYDCVLGNHEQMCIDFKGNPYQMFGGYGANIYNMFGGNGGNKTLDSYKKIDLLINDIESFMKHLPIYKIYDVENSIGQKLIVSHSSINNFIDEDLNLILDESIHEDEFDVKQDIIWNREILYDLKMKNIKKLDNYYNIFGHTIFQEPIINEKYACIDTGVYSKGTLTSLAFPSMKIYQQKNIDFDENYQYR